MEAFSDEIMYRLLCMKYSLLLGRLYKVPAAREVRNEWIKKERKEDYIGFGEKFPPKPQSWTCVIAVIRPKTDNS